MTLDALLNRLVVAGITIRAAGDRIKYSAPRGAMTQELARATQEHRAEILKLLEGGRPDTEDKVIVLVRSVFPDAQVCDPYAEAERDAIESEEVYHA